MSTASSIFGVTPASSTATEPAAWSSQIMSQDDFLKLLVAQMTSQNPVDPMNNQDLLTQMVQFSTLQQNTSLQKELSALGSSQNLMQANALLGRQISVWVDSNTVTQGVVSGVIVDSGVPKVVVDGTAYNLSDVFAISTPAPSP
jgi:flagellar basal-body rod modification protein FlgD